MSKRVIIIILILGLVFSFPGIWSRFQTERSSNGVDLVMDYHALESLAENEDLTVNEVLDSFSESGLTSVAIYADTLKDLVNQGKARLFTGNEITRTQDQTGTIDPLFAIFPFSNDSVFIKIKEGDVIKRAEQYLTEWKKEYQIEYRYQEQQLVLYFEEWDPRFLHLSFGLNDPLVNDLKARNLRVIPRINNNKLSNELNWSLLANYQPPYIIFAGSELTGYDKEPTERELERTAQVMKANNTLFGMIEPYIAYQRGAVSLARQLDYGLLRVHSIQQGEMDSNKIKYSLVGIVDRYLRAVRERNVRVLYLKPFLEEKEEEEPFQLTAKFLRTLSSELKDNGYNMGKIEPLTNYSNSMLELLVIGLGITAAGLILLNYLLGQGLQKLLLRYYWVFLVLFLLLEILLVAQGKAMLLRKVLALASSIIFPALAVISQLLAGKGKGWLDRFLRAALLSLTGVIFLVASLAHISFSLQVEQFSGVKFSFVFPLLIISLYYIKTFSRKPEFQWRKKVSDFMEINLKVKHLLLMLIIGFIGAIYIGRTGNFPALPVPNFEIIFREWLEKILFVRPRFKEFLIGHPMMIIALKLVARFKDYLFFYPLLILASIGQINILNTFSHTHTPLIVSLVRTFHGLWLGLIIGIIFWKLIITIGDFWKRKRV